MADKSLEGPFTHVATMEDGGYSLFGKPESGGNFSEGRSGHLVVHQALLGGLHDLVHHIVTVFRRQTKRRLLGFGSVHAESPSKDEGLKHGSRGRSINFVTLMLISLGMLGCGPSHHLFDGYSSHAMFIRSVPGSQEFAPEVREIENIKIIIVRDHFQMPCLYHLEAGTEIVGCAISAGNVNVIYVKGKMTDKGLIVPVDVLGHEILHLIEGGRILPIHDYKKF
jgi:hypothetical protein